MNPLAAAFLAAQGWDASNGHSGQKQPNELHHDVGQYAQLNQNGPQTDFQALLNNPAILQALTSQMQGGFQPAPTVQPGQPPMPDVGNIYSQNLTPGQTTRSGRISRPPVAAPMQDQLSLLQQILGPSNGNSVHVQQPDQGAGPSRQPMSSQMPQPPTQTTTARTSGVKRPHSALRDTSNPPQLSTSVNSVNEEPPLVRPVPTSINGRPRKGDVTSKEERLERRRIQNSQSAADYRKKKELYIQSLEDRLKEKELEVKAKAEECEKWRQKFVDMEKQHVVLAALWTAAGFSLPDGNGNMQSTDRFPPSAPNMLAPPLGRPSTSSMGGAQSGVRTVPEARNAPSMSPASMNPPIRSPVPLVSAQITPNHYPSPAQLPTPLASASNTLAVGMPTSNHPTMSPLTTLPGSSPVETPDNQPFDFGVDLSAFDDFFNWDIMPDNDADDQQDADFVPASSPKRDSDSGSDDETDTGEAGQVSKKRRKRKGKSKQKSRKDGRGEDDDDFVDPEEDEEDLFMPITDVEVPPGQMQLVEKATQDVMSTFGVDSQAQLTGVMQKIVDAGDGLTGEQLEKMKSVLRWMQMSGHLPGHLSG